MVGTPAVLAPVFIQIVFCSLCAVQNGWILWSMFASSLMWSQTSLLIKI